MNDALVTFFTAPKPFTDPHINIIQRNAIRSWKNLGDSVQIFLMGNDSGITEAARDLQVRHFPQVRCNEKCTPLISSMLQVARENSQSPYLCIINTDILVLPEMLTVLKSVAEQMEKFLLVGQRWDAAITELLPADDSLFPFLRKELKRIGKLHPPMGSDYFLFPRACYTSIPDFAIGRAGWDNWMIYKARLEGWKVIDGSRAITIIHQDHDYSHFKDGKAHYHQPETKVNVKLAGGEHTIYTLQDAQWKIIDGKIERLPVTWKRFWREVEIFPAAVLKSPFLAKLSYYLFHPKKAYAFLRSRMTKRSSD